MAFALAGTFRDQWAPLTDGTYGTRGGRHISPISPISPIG
jgi:hypothetical protein